MKKSATRTVLVIEDDNEYRGLLAENLRQDRWEVLEASDGEEGIRLAKTHQPGIILCDLLMAGVNGFEVCRSVRRFDPLRRTRIVVLSGRDFEADRQAALDAGADQYLVKPIEPQQLRLWLSKLPSAPISETPAGPVASDSDHLRLKFWGVRGSIPTPGPSTIQYGGNTSCVEIRAEGRIIILDGGTGLRLLGRELLLEFGEQPLELVLLLSHTHWDHIQGLPFFGPVYQPQNSLRILGYEGARHGLDNVLSSQMESPFFPINFKEVAANVRIEELQDLQFNIGRVEVQACFAYHPGMCVGYRLSAGERSVAFFPDNELRHPAPGPGGTPAGASLEFARSENQKLTEFLRGTDVLIMDTQYDREEYRQHIGWGHGCLDEVVALALEADIKQLFLFHHDPDHDDAKVTQMTGHARAIAAAQGSSLQIDAAKEGLTLELPLREPMLRPAMAVDH